MSRGEVGGPVKRALRAARDMMEYRFVSMVERDMIDDDWVKVVGVSRGSGEIGLSDVQRTRTPFKYKVFSQKIRGYLISM